jgi:hypothetical protein
MGLTERANHMRPAERYLCSYREEFTGWVRHSFGPRIARRSAYDTRGIRAAVFRFCFNLILRSTLISHDKNCPDLAQARHAR